MNIFQRPAEDFRYSVGNGCARQESKAEASRLHLARDERHGARKLAHCRRQGKYGAEPAHGSRWLQHHRRPSRRKQVTAIRMIVETIRGRAGTRPGRQEAATAGADIADRGRWRGSLARGAPSCSHTSGCCSPAGRRHSGRAPGLGRDEAPRHHQGRSPR